MTAGKGVIPAVVATAANCISSFLFAWGCIALRGQPRLRRAESSASNEFTLFSCVFAKQFSCLKQQELAQAVVSGRCQKLRRSPTMHRPNYKREPLRRDAECRVLSVERQQVTVEYIVGQTTYTDVSG